MKHFLHLNITVLIHAEMMQFTCSIAVQLNHIAEIQLSSLHCMQQLLANNSHMVHNCSNNYRRLVNRTRKDAANLLTVQNLQLCNGTQAPFLSLQNSKPTENKFI
uniref:Putative secreted protein n=1 Tax=Amblyomma triste TaxID=251400 RepID=A0A023G435_AMBTT